MPVQNLVSDYLTTYNIDLIGMEKSEKPLEGWDYTFANDAKIISKLMDEWRYEKMIITGDDGVEELHLHLQVYIQKEQIF